MPTSPDTAPAQGGPQAAGPGGLAGLRIDKAALTPRRRFPWLRLLLAIALAAGGWWLYASGLLTPAAEVRVATVAPLYPSQTFTVQSASGYVVAQRKAEVAAKITALLTEMLVEEGVRVRAGQVLARQESRLQQTALRQAAAALEAAGQNLEAARAELAEATLNHRRFKALAGADVVSRSEFDAAENRFRQARAAVTAREADIAAARAALAEAEVALDDTLIRAPFDAVVLTKDADVGDIVTPLGATSGVKAAVVSIADMASLQVEADVAESSISQIRHAMPAEVQLDALPGERFPAKVHMVVPTADRAKASVQVKVAFQRLDPRILPEMSAKVAFLSRPVADAERQAVLAVPAQALTTRDGRTAALVVEGGLVREAFVATGRALGDQREILSGLEAGWRVVLSPAAELVHGAKVKVVE